MRMRAPEEKDEQGSKLANQVCHWKDEMISVEIDIKITGKGCTVCKWYGIDENTCRAHAHKMHTSNATKITKHQVLISNSSKHHIALLQR